MTRREREITDPEEIRGILDESRVIHLGLCAGGVPYVVPMNYGYELVGGKYVFYVHGARAGRKYDVLRENPVVAFEMECGVTPFEAKAWIRATAFR